MVLESKYTELWLSENKSHPLQKLWARNDELASHELYTLGTSIDQMIKIDYKWTIDQIKLSKSFDRKNSQGAIFELIGLALMHSKKHPVVPSKSNQPGYDGKLIIGGTKQMRVSIKNYGMSESQKMFETKAKQLEGDVVRLLKKFAFPPALIFVDFPFYYPQKSDWQLLIDRLEATFDEHKFSADGFLGIAMGTKGVCYLQIKPLIDTGQEFHENYQSYTLIVGSVYHPNENKNLYSKIEDACANLVKHSIKEDGDILNSLLLHLPTNASVENCEKWAQEYFELYPHKQISAIFFLQPAVVRDEKTGNSFIQYSCRMHVREERFDKWKPNGFNFIFSLPVGSVSSESAKNTIIAEYPDGTIQKLTVDERYIYQTGQHYMKMQSDGNGGYTGNMYQPGSGVFVNSVIQFPGQPESVAITGRFQPSDDLLIL